MKAVWKYPVAMDAFMLPMPLGAKVLSVDMQAGQGPQMWVLVDPDAPKRTRYFFTVGTGHVHSIYDDDQFIGTFQMMGGSLIWHLFERTRGIEETTP